MTPCMQYTTNSAEETKQIAKTLAKSIDHGVVALTGDLGAGKTTFTQGFAEGLGVNDKIISPTFILIRQHPIPKTKKVLYHIDLYRLENEGDIKDLGIQEIIETKENIVLIEWADKIRNLLPTDTIWVTLERIDENRRKIVVK